METALYELLHATRPLSSFNLHASDAAAICYGEQYEFHNKKTGARERVIYNARNNSGWFMLMQDPNTPGMHIPMRLYITFANQMVELRKKLLTGNK